MFMRPSRPPYTKGVPSLQKKTSRNSSRTSQDSRVTSSIITGAAFFLAPTWHSLRPSSCKVQPSLYQSCRRRTYLQLLFGWKTQRHPNIRTTAHCCTSERKPCSFTPRRLFMLRRRKTVQDGIIQHHLKWILASFKSTCLFSGFST